jgi:predicted transglutaminase-like cysteine proteinase
MALASAALLAQPAQASISVIAIPAAVSSAFAGIDICQGGSAPPASYSPPVAAVPSFSKASALLGGQVSQLDLIRQQQAGAAPVAPPQITALAATARPEPGAGASNLGAAGSQSCTPSLGFATHFDKVAPSLGTTVLLPSAPSSDDYLASKRLSVKRTSFDRDWNRVRSSGLGRKAFIGISRSPDGVHKLELDAINAWANGSIRYVEDRELYGEADHWATASETMRRRAGDCEDIAIVKMQMLAAYGVKREDMNLVIARDLVRSADHAILVVKIDGRYWLLDNATDQVLDAQQSYDYRPILSFSQNTKWIHGY